MTKLSAGQIQKLFTENSQGFAAILLFGPDQGLVRERRDKLVKAAVADPKDPFLVAELSGKQVKDEPGRLWDEATAQSLIGGKRAIIIRDCTDANASLFKSFLETPKGDALIVLEAGELSPRSSLRKAFEQSKTGAAAGCYSDDGRQLRGLIHECLSGYGLRLDRAAEPALIDRLGSDRQVTRMELEKLALYCHGKDLITLDDVEATVGDSSLSTMENVIDDALLGQTKALEQGLNRCFDEGQQPVTLVRTLMRRLDRIDLVRHQLDRGQSMDQALKVLKPPVNFKQIDSFRAQAKRWQASMIKRARHIALEAEIAAKSSGGLPAVQVSRALLSLAQAARRAR